MYVGAEKGELVGCVIFMFSMESQQTHLGMPCLNIYYGLSLYINVGTLTIF